jgi:peptidoglycan/LPS O-acetylase OafA/YrhL
MGNSFFPMNSTKETDKRSTRYASLDAWRGAACLAIIIYHSSLVYQATLYEKGLQSPNTLSGHLIDLTHFLSWGVPVFFVISGYCISATADNNRFSGKGVSDYFRRRFRRIFPPYWVVFFLSAALITVISQLPVLVFLMEGTRPLKNPWEMGFSQWLGNITLTETWRYHLFGLPRAQFIGQSWTLCYEEQFYAVVGLFLAIAPKSFFQLAAVTTVLCVALHASLQATGISDAGFFFDGNWSLFAAGILIYFQINYASSTQKKVCYLILLATSIAGFYFKESYRHGLGIAAIFSIVAAYSFRWDERIVSSVLAQPFLYCGKMCYSLYLVHQIVVTVIQKSLFNMGLESAEETLFITIPLCTIASLLAGAFFYRHVETRFLSTAKLKNTGMPVATSAIG